ncbi:hypothetical protein [Paenibacillus dakarensis]|uniref:hypothetical protein n=1 Tax=Paenibacillus dakarensis TaxID=1527293 RepID=UPI0006D54E83|nr:hypothetical protein [Paenibacillus dakarensis]
MVDEATKLGELLKLPNLEDDTIKLINQKLRELIGEVKPMPPEVKEQMISVVDEWLNGTKKEGG